MKRKTKFIIFTGILSVISLAGCLVDEELSQKVENKDILDITVEEAKEYFESSVRTFHLSPPRTTRMVNDELLSTPMWEKAMVLDIEGRRVVEIPVDAPFANICKRDNLKDSISTKKGFINTIVRLVAEKDADDKILFTIVRITGDNKYILRHRKKFFKMKINSVDEFSGMIKYYTLQGKLISGKKYESGNVVATISPVDVTPPKVQTRAMEEQCDFVYYQVDDYYCQDVYVGGELLSQSCELVDSWTEAVWECQMVEVPDQEFCPNCGQNPCICEDSGGGSGDVVIVTKAKKIFKNDNMTIADWNKLEALLNSIMEDCMGRELYYGLFNLLNGNTISFQFTSEIGAAYNFQNNSLRLNRDMDSNELFHEMIHAYQYQNGESFTSFLNARLNFDIEAHYAQYIYLKGTLEYDTSNFRQGTEGKNRRITAVMSLANYVNDKGELLPGVSKEIVDAYLEYNVTEAFRSTTEYADYLFDTNRDCVSTFSNINKLTKDC